MWASKSQLCLLKKAGDRLGLCGTTDSLLYAKVVSPSVGRIAMTRRDRARSCTPRSRRRYASSEGSRQHDERISTVHLCEKVVKESFELAGRCRMARAQFGDTVESSHASKAKVQSHESTASAEAYSKTLEHVEAGLEDALISRRDHQFSGSGGAPSGSGGTACGLGTQSPISMRPRAHRW